MSAAQRATLNAQLLVPLAKAGNSKKYDINRSHRPENNTSHRTPVRIEGSLYAVEDRPILFTNVRHQRRDLSAFLHRARARLIRRRDCENREKPRKRGIRWLGPWKP